MHLSVVMTARPVSVRLAISYRFLQNGIDRYDAYGQSRDNKRDGLAAGVAGPVPVEWIGRRCGNR